VSEGEQPGLSALLGASDEQLVTLVRSGKEAEAALSRSDAPAAGYQARISLELQLARGIEAWNTLFERHRPTLDAFCRNKGLLWERGARAGGRGEAVQVAARKLTVEDFENEVWIQVWERHKTASWRGDGPFGAWYRMVLQSIWAEWYRRQAREDPTDPPVEGGDALGAITVSDGDTAGPEPSAPISEAGATRRDESGALAERARAHRHAVESLTINRRVIYRLAYGLPLSDEDRHHIAARSGRPGPECELRVDGFYARYGTISETRETEAWAEAEKRFLTILKLERDLEGTMRQREKLLATSDVIRVAGDEEPKVIWSRQEALDALEHRIERKGERLRAAWRVQQEAREQALATRRAVSKDAAQLLGTTPENVDQLLRRAELDVARLLVQEGWRVESRRKQG
jgi:RNA polymerase sigma factor (sigma-70 family)